MVDDTTKRATLPQEGGSYLFLMSARNIDRGVCLDYSTTSATEPRYAGQVWCVQDAAMEAKSITKQTTITVFFIFFSIYRFIIQFLI